MPPGGGRLRANPVDRTRYDLGRLRMHAGRRVLALAALVGCALVARAATASPIDSKVGDVRVAYGKKGTTLRADAAVTAAASATLPAGTRVSVLEVKLPWLRVQKEGGTE